jgi:hydrogenase nickel incorporation protein HypB
MFRAADLVLLSKADLTPVLGDFDPRRAENYLRQLANAAPLIELSSRSGQGMQAWADWLVRAWRDHRDGPVPAQNNASHATGHAHG